MSTEYSSWSLKGACVPTSTGPWVSGGRSFTLPEVVEASGVEFDTLLADCEGCLQPFAEAFGLTRFRTIILYYALYRECQF